jgi:ABC-type branched-subunit amino acid transport system permease subunit
MTIIGGMGSLVGPVIGAALVTVCQLYLSSYFESWLLIFGGIFVIVVLFLPKGLINIVYSSRMKKRSTGLEMNKKPYGSSRG